VPEEDQSGKVVNPIPRRSRAALLVAGLLSWLAGSVATFLNGNGPGAVALIAAGSAALLLGLVGRWPQRVGISGSEVAWDEVTRTVKSAIAVSESDPQESATNELRGLLSRLEELRLTGSAPEHPAEAYDRAVQAAIRRLMPTAVIARSDVRSRSVADFRLDLDGRTLFVETKWRQDVERPFGGSTLPQLVRALPQDARLLVVSNARDVSGGQKALEQLKPSSAQIITWRDVRDDDLLARALRTVLSAT
jgi:hypothetical protein